eukprot:TRINITY_DN15174_c0_g1_i3.p1 TRINITY_DN15174_c0_g1~~TRINITY_DN15174_c0_g1_i3.p1  ORF type:complete len:130 (+),score=24.65 TRINITY_DN15174_c0_g1_i3:87-476(+)
MKGTKSTKPLKQLKLSVPAQETPITNFLTASGTFQDGDLLLNQRGLRLVSEEKETRPADAKEVNHQFSLEDLETIKVIGKGSGGVVQLVRHKWLGTLFALKHTEGPSTENVIFGPSEPSIHQKVRGQRP